MFVSGLALQPDAQAFSTQKLTQVGIVAGSVCAIFDQDYEWQGKYDVLPQYDISLL